MTYSFNTLPSVLLVAMAATAATSLGCATQEPVELGGDGSHPTATNTTESGLYQNVAKWPPDAYHVGGASALGADIPVCYILTPGQTASQNDLERKFVTQMKLWAGNTWGRIADINFQDWSECGTSLNGRLVIQFMSTGRALTDFLGYPGASSYNTIHMIAGAGDVTVLHEFGHALGFFHEFSRKDWPDPPGHVRPTCHQDADCSSYGDNGYNCTSQTPNVLGYCYAAGGTPLSPDADFESVMASTYVGNTIEKDASGITDPIHKLSAWDVLGAQKVYGRKAGGTIVGLGGLCMNLAGGSSDLGAAVQSYKCNGLGNDSWKVSASPQLAAKASDGTARCASVANGVTSTTSGTPITAWSCNGDANEKFRFAGVKWRAMGMCVQGGNGTTHSQLALAACTAPNTDWDFDFHAGSITLSGTSLCANVPNGTESVNNVLQLYPCGSPLDAAGTFSFGARTGEIKYGGLCVNAQNDLAKAGELVQLYGCSSPAPRNSSFFITGPIRGLNGQCLDVPNGRVDNNVGLQVLTCDSGGSMKQTWDYHF